MSIRLRKDEREQIVAALEAEQWKPIPGFPGYDVSNRGNVRSWLNTGARAALTLRGEPVPRRLTLLGGYPGLALRANGKYYRRAVHGLVMLAFVGPPGPGQQVRHLDGRSTNASLGNLCYGTKAENEADKDRHGTRPFGEGHARAKLTDAQVAEIRLARRAGESCTSIARKYGISHQHVSGLTVGNRRAV